MLRERALERVDARALQVQPHPQRLQPLEHKAEPSGLATPPRLCSLPPLPAPAEIEIPAELGSPLLSTPPRKAIALKQPLTC